MAKMTTEELLDVFKEMSILELSEFKKAFEEEFDVTAAAPMAVAAVAADGGGGAPAEEEKDEFDVIPERAEIVKRIFQMSIDGYGKIT